MEASSLARCSSEQHDEKISYEKFSSLKWDIYCSSQITANCRDLGTDKIRKGVFRYIRGMIEGNGELETPGNGEPKSATEGADDAALSRLRCGGQQTLAAIYEENRERLRP